MGSFLYDFRTIFHARFFFNQLFSNKYPGKFLYCADYFFTILEQ